MVGIHRKFSFGAAAVLLLPGVLHAQVVLSDFSAGVDGWQKYSGGDSGTTVSWTSTGGNGGGGGLILNDAAQGINDYFDAPAKFLGNQAGFLGGSLSFDLEVSQLPLDNTGAPNNDYPDAVVLTANIAGNTVAIAHRLALAPVTTGFTSYAISLTDTSGWYVAGGLYSNTISPGQMQSVLSNLTDLRILADWHNGVENDALDNVQIAAVPEPSTLSLLSLAVAAAVLAALVRVVRGPQGCRRPG